MHSSKLLLLSIASLATAASKNASTLSFYMPGIYGAELLAQSIGQDSNATTYVLGCHITATTFCGVTLPVVLRQGPETAVYTGRTSTRIGYEAVRQDQIDCSLDGTAVADCTQWYTVDAVSSQPTNVGTHLEITSHLLRTRIYYKTAAIVTDTANIWNYGTGWDSSSTSYSGIVPHTDATTTSETAFAAHVTGLGAVAAAAVGAVLGVAAL